MMYVTFLDTVVINQWNEAVTKTLIEDCERKMVHQCSVRNGQHPGLGSYTNDTLN